MSPPGAKGNPIQELGETILPQIYHSADLGYTDINRVAIMGTSYGGYGTAAMLTQTNLFRAGIAMGGDYDLGGDYGHMDPDGVIDFALYEGGQTRMGTHPWADLKRYVTNSPFYQADKINTPLLLIHGEDDPTCPVEESRKMFAALKRLGKRLNLPPMRREDTGQDSSPRELYGCSPADA